MRNCKPKLMHPLLASCALLVGIGGWAIVASVAIAEQKPNKPIPTSTAGTNGNSSQAAIDLAQHLRQTGAKMYGAYWCPHCHEQRELFGEKAFNLYINYVECAPDGYHAKPEICKAEEIQAYPTWKINGKTYLGVHSLDELATLSNYQGSRDF